MPAIGQAAARLHGDTWFDVTQWGAIPGDSTTGSVDRACEAIRNWIINVRDAGLPAGSASPAVFYFPESTKNFWMQRPCFMERSHWEVRGAGRFQSMVSAVAGGRYPCFIFGVQRRPTGASYVGWDGSTPILLDPNHWVDSFGILDTSAVPAAGQKWGWRFRNNSYVTCPRTPFSDSTADTWAGTRQMTVDFCIDIGTGLVNGQPLFGMYGPSPWYFTGIGGNGIKFVFATTGLNQPALQAVQFQLGAVTGIVRVSFQIDLINATTQAWVNGTQVTVSINFPSAFLAANNMAFPPNQCTPFNLGMYSAASLSQDTTLSPPVDHTYYGLRIANTLLYQNGGVGNPQLNAIGTHVGVAPTDFERYFDTTRNCVAMFTMADPPTGNANCYNDGRCVTITGGSDGATHGAGVNAIGYFLTTCTSSTPVMATGQRIADINVSNGAPRGSGFNGTKPGGWSLAYGAAILIGAVWEMYIEGVTASGNGQGIGAINGGAIYTVRATDIVASGGDAAYYGYNQGLDLDDFRVVNMGRTGIRLVSPFGTMNDLVFGDSFNCDACLYVHSGSYAGSLDIVNFMSDNEAGDGPSMAGIVFEASTSTIGYLRIRGIGFGKVGDNAVLIWMKDKNSGTGDYTNPGTGNSLKVLDVEELSTFGVNHAANIRIDGTLTGGEVRNFQVSTGGYAYSEAVPMFDFTGPGGKGRVVSIHNEYGYLPSGGKWDRSNHRLNMQFPADGHYALVRPCGSGAYGTATPPVWDGADLIDSTGGNSVGGYAQGNTYAAGTF